MMCGMVEVVHVSNEVINREWWVTFSVFENHALPLATGNGCLSH